MFLAKLLITREGYYGPGYANKDLADKPLRCTIEVIGEQGKTELNLPQDVSDKIIALVADEMASAARAVAETMTAQFIMAGTAAALAAPAEEAPVA